MGSQPSELERLRALLDGVEAGTAWLGPDLAVAFANRPLQAWLGLRGEQIEGASLPALLGADAAREAAPLARAALAGEPGAHEVYCAPAGGTPRLLRLSWRPHRVGPRDVAGVLLRAEAAAADDEVRRGQERRELEAVQRVARIGTYRTDLVRGVWTASEGFCRIFGFEMGGVYTMEEFQAIVHPDDFEAVMGHFGWCLENRQPFDHEYRCITRDTGRTIHVRSTSQVFYAQDGTPSHILGMKQDITEQKELERQFVSSQRVEAIGQLTGGIAHDFNNLLTAIIGFHDLAREALPESSPALEHLGQVGDAAARAQRLTQQLLAFSRRKTVRPRVLGLNRSVEDLLPLLGRLVGEEIVIDCDLAPELWSVRADRGSIDQIVVNLVVNARDALARGGHIRIETANVPDAEGDQVELRVVDDGRGMDRETLDRALEPFFTTKPEGQGTGLGFSTCLGLVQQAGGSLELRSGVGAGTTVSVRLPRVDAVATTPTGSHALPVLDLSGQERLLLAEDDPAVRKLTRLALERRGYEVAVASDGVAALELLEAAERPFDLLVTDVVMPGMRGTELAAAAREGRPGLKVLFMSGYAAESLGGPEALGPGSDLLEKPFRQDDLATRVRRLLDR